MSKKINRKKFSLKKDFFYYLFFFILISISIFYILVPSYKIENFILTSVQKLSTDYNYILSSYDITGLNNIDEEEILTIIKPYFNTSIFFIPLNDISNLILEKNWVENVKLSINYKNKILIEINEFKPIGIYTFNGNNYYFNSKGKIIDYAGSNNQNNFIIFSGKSSTSNANLLINTIKLFKKDFQNEISQAKFVGNRRWDLLLKNGLYIKLSENNLHESIENYFKLSNNLKYSDFIDIKLIDLRDFRKVIIEYK